MNKILSVLVVLLSIFGTFAAHSDVLPNENLNYVISYKWGLIHKDAGTATLSLRSSNSNYEVILAGRTKPWADKFYQVRDTLLGTIRIHDMKPLKYTKIAHEKGKYGKDVITYNFSGDHTTGYCKRYKRNKDGEVTQSEKKLTATGPVYDMLSVFYYLRNIDYRKLQRGEKIVATVFSGSKAETITIRSLGKERVQLRDKSHREAYHIKFNFTTEGKKKSSDDIDAWISSDSRHIPLYLVGSLAVGQVRVYYTGG